MSLLDFNTENPDNFSKERIIQTDNNTIVLRRYNPYGLVKISFKKGNIPRVMQGEFTSFEEAIRVVELYMNKQGKKTTLIHEDLNYAQE